MSIISRKPCVLAALCAVVVSPIAAAQCAEPAAGADVVPGAIQGVTRWGRLGDITAFTFGTVICNIGDAGIQVVAETPAHPAVTAGVYRLRDGRFEQVGLSWTFHEYFVLPQSVCCPCNSSSSGVVLPPGCSSVTSAGIFGARERLSGRSQVRPDTGVVQFPFDSVEEENTIAGRLQIRDADLDPALNPGASYFVEIIYVAAEDAAAGNTANNASHRPIELSAAPDNVYNFSTTGAFHRGEPAINAWAAADPSVSLATVDVQGDGRFIVGSNATDLGAGMWRYEYAVYNSNSDRAGGAFSVPVAAGVNITNIGFHDVAHHSGEPYDGADWSVTLAGGVLTWSTEDFATNEHANALRWGTLYNFRFDADAPPAEAQATLGLFKPGSPGAPASVAASISAPAADACPADFDGDGVVGSADLAILLGSWGPEAGPGAGADLSGDGQTGSADLALLLGAWGPCN